jgi:GNAT superfamily N-acetyltransferase
MSVAVRPGRAQDVDPAIEVFRRSNRARRQGVWPQEHARVEQVRAELRRPDVWFLVADDDSGLVGMAAAMPYRTGAGTGSVLAGVCYLDLVFVVPEEWGKGIGGALLAATIDEATRRGYSEIRLSTHELDNERAQRLYARNGFTRRGPSHLDGEGSPVAEWVRSLE